MNPSSATLSTPSPRGRRRWWVYVLWLFGLGFALIVALGIALALYWNYLVRTYTSTQPKPIPVVEGAAEKFPDLKQRWDAYALLFLHPERDIPDFELSSEDLNVFASRFGPFGKHTFVEIRDSRFHVQFSAPLDATRNASLQGRYLNGVATFSPKLANGKLELFINTFEANGRPIPNWLLRRLRRTNWAERLNQRPEFDLAIRALEKIELGDDKLLLQPRPPGNPR